MNFRMIGAAVLTVGALAIAPNAKAVDVTGNLNISVTINKKCTMTAPADITIAAQDGVESNGNVDFAGELKLKCTKGTPYFIGINEGGGTGATDSTRKMQGTGANTDELAYNLYKDSGRTANWGNTGTDRYEDADGNPSGAEVTIPVYGRLPGTDVSADTYTDTVLVTLTY